MNLKSILPACGLLLLMTLGVRANNMLVQNVTTLGNDAVNKTIQVQFDISWDNSWRDAINYDAAWIFMKFKNASGVWQHVQLNQTSFVNGTGTANTVQVTNDKVGCWLYRTGLGSGTFNTTGMQLQWNYGLAGLTNVTGLEVRVFAVEMVYVPEGEFNCAGTPNGNYTPIRSFSYSSGSAGGVNGAQPGLFYAPGLNFPVINNRLSPSLLYNDGITINIRIKGDTGIDFDNDGVVDNIDYPTGFRSIFCFKYEMSEHQYADFLNTLTSEQVTTLGVAGTGITTSNGEYFSSTPYMACGNSNASRFFAYADWSGLRPMTFLEFNKISYGTTQPVYNSYSESGGENRTIKGYSAWGGQGLPTNFSFRPTIVGSSATPNSNRLSSGASFYGILDLTGSIIEPTVKLRDLGFTSANGNGFLNADGSSNLSNWNSDLILFIDNHQSYNNTSGNQYFPYNPYNFGFRYVRSAE